MKFFSLCEQKLTLAVLCLAVNVSNAQLRTPFTQLNLPSHLSNGFFLPQSHNTLKMPDPFSVSDTLNASQCAALFMSMGRASLDSTHVLTDFSGFREHKDSVAHSEGCYSMALMDLQYLDFLPDALTNGMIYRQDGLFYHSLGCAQSPCLQKEACVLWVDAPHIQSRFYSFKLSSVSFISNYDDAPDSVRIHFDDGMGWRLLHANQVYEVDYSTEIRNRVVRCEIYRQGRVVKHAACLLKYNDEYDVCGTSGMPLPGTPPWSSATDNPWDVQVEFEGDWVKGRAYTLNSADGVFDKPFLFVEGIDFGIDRDGHPIHDWQRHGTFGWCEFASGFQDPDVNDDIIYGYDDLHLMPQLLQHVIAQGYDVVMIDFYDGATWLQRNSELVQHVIRLCNEFKNGDEPLVIAGASMGGVLSRHALRTMELNGEDHCTRLWISMDAPHEGAHIPLSLQHAIRFSAEHGQEQAQLFRQRYLLRPAARQMLDAQVFNSLDDFEAWYNPMRDMGYPQHCRSVAISNGMSNGDGLTYSFDELMDWDCSTSGVMHSKLLLLPETGDPYNEFSYSGNNVLAHFRAPILGWDAIGDEWFYWLGGLILGAIDAIDIDEEVVYVEDGLFNRDYAPGGKRNTTQIFASATNRALEAINDNDFNITICELASPADYNPDHTFVMSASSVGLRLDDPYADVNEYLWSHPEENYFDRIQFADALNENHTELTVDKLNFVLQEVLSYDLVTLDTALTDADQNEGYFNFGKPEYSYLKSIHVHQGGRLHINAFTNTHFNEPIDYLSTQGHFEVTTSPCSPEIILVDHGGEVSIGDAVEEYRTGSLTIGRDSKLLIGEDGVARVNPGSSLVIEEGGLLEVYPEGKVVVQSGTIIIRAGAICRFVGRSTVHFQHEIVLSGSDARWLFDGGSLEIDGYTTLSMDPSVEETGYLEVMPGTENMLRMDLNSVFHWRGKGTDDVIMRINNGAHLQNANWMQGAIHLQDGKVDLTYHGAIYTDAHLSAENVLFYASDLWEAEGCEVWKWFGQSSFIDCVFEHVDLHAQQSKTTLSGCEFLGPNAGFHAYEGVYSIEGTTFNHSACTSQDLIAISILADCAFIHDSEFHDWSNQKVVIKRTEFSDVAGNPIDKVGGSLSLRCNSFENTGNVLVSEAALDMSASLDGGMNSFRSMDHCIRLNNAAGLFLEEGGNDFSGCLNTIIQGSVDTLCGLLECNINLLATQNHWGYEVGAVSAISGLAYPPQDRIQLVSSNPSLCGGYESAVQCELFITDDSPVEPPQCNESTKSLVKEPLASSTHWIDFLNGLGGAFGEAMLELYDVKGSLVAIYQVHTGDLFRCDEYSLSSGMYLFSFVEFGSRTSIVRVVE
jgi:hypothetical protein